MKSFKQYIQENYDFHGEVDKHIKAGEIVKPKFASIKNDIDKEVRKHRDQVFNAHMVGTAAKMSKEHETVQDIGWNIPDSLNGVKALAKRVARAQKAGQGNHPLVKDAHAMVQKWHPLAEKMDALKGKVVTTATKRAEKKEVEAKEQKKRFSDSSSLVNTLTKHKDEFVEAARKRAGEMHDEHTKAIKKAGGLDAIAPKPHSRMGRDEYRMAQAHRARYQYYHETPKKQHIENEANDAHADYMAWVNKMTQKIGKPVVKSSMTGSPWTGSHIHVHTNDGEEQHWHTQMIINRSKHGKLFNQFPTRQKK